MNSSLSFKPFWCHNCRTQELLNTSQSNLSCPRCHSDLIEEIESFDMHPAQFIVQGLEPRIRQAPQPQPFHFFQIVTTTFLNSHRGAPPASQNDINLLENVQNAEGECSICQDELSGQVKRMRCGHMFHFDCLRPWLNIHNTCPVCRIPLR